MSDTIPSSVDNCHAKEDDEILISAAQNSLAGFKQLYAKWLSPVYRYFYYRVGNVKEAEDLTSQLFLKIYEELPRYTDRGQFSAWLFTIARHMAANYFRKRPLSVSLETEIPADQSIDLLGQTIQDDEIRRLRRLIRSLPEREQELIRLRFIVGLGYREIAEVINQKEDAVRKSLSRLLTRLQSQLEENHG